MGKVSIDYSQIQLEENIPLTDSELNNINVQRKGFFKDAPGILLAVMILIILIACYLLKDEFINFKYYHYILFFCVASALYAFFYLIMYLVYMYFVQNWEKDIRNGKNSLKSIITSQHTTENDEYIFTFSGRNKDEKIKLPVSKDDYLRYKTGMQVAVVYLKHSKVVLSLEELEIPISDQY